MYQTLEPIILNPLTHIINLALRVIERLDVGNNALVIPVLKSGSKNKASNYLPSSLLPISHFKCWSFLSQITFQAVGNLDVDEEHP